MKRLTASLLALLLLVTQMTNLFAAPLALPPAQASEDEGGPAVIVGEAVFGNTEITITGQEPVVALIDMSHIVEGDTASFAPLEGQILGQLTSPLESPVSYRVALPISPSAGAVDVDNDDEADAGVQIFRLALVSNLNGGSWLEQLDQWGYLNSYLLNTDGEITEGSFLLYAADDQQGFPSAKGEDGLLFTEDDPIAPLASGYTIARLAADGTVTFDRTAEGRMDILEEVGAAYPDLSDMGILESYNALLDILRDEYVFTDLRQLDWDAIRATWLPDVEAADAAGDITAYGVALRKLAQSIRDAHVQLRASLAPSPQIAANLGANVLELSDGRFVVTEIVPGSALDEAGIGFGTEIVTIDGQPVEERIPNVIYDDSTGTEEGQRLRQVRNLLRFPAGAEVELGYRLPDASEVTTATLTAAPHQLPNPLVTTRGVEAIRYNVIDGTFGYVTWLNFEDPIPTVDAYADFLTRLNAREITPGIDASGLILDMRSNGGGWDIQYLTMASYLFDAENPVPFHWVDEAVFDAESGKWVADAKADWLLSAPREEAYFGGDVVVLVDTSCGSSCEFFTSLLASQERVTVVGAQGSAGAGGAIKVASLPGGLAFQYTWKGGVYAGTDELVFEGQGVNLDVRVPATLESEQARLDGGDPVLDAGIETLKQLAADRLLATTTTVSVTEASGLFTTVAPEGWAQQGNNFFRPNGADNLGFQVATPPIADLAPVLASQGITDMESAFVEEREANGFTWSIYQLPIVSAGVELNRQYAIASDDAHTYVLVATSLGFQADAMREAVLHPAIDSFTPMAAQ